MSVPARRGRPEGSGVPSGALAGEIKFAASGPVLHKYVQSRAPMQIIKGPLGSGKTTGSIFKLMKTMAEQTPDENGVRRSRGLVTRATYPELISTTIADWKTVFPPETFGAPVMGHPPIHKLDFHLPDGTRVKAEVYFVALDRPQDIVKTKGINLTWAYMNEVKQQPKAIWDELDSRVNRWPFFMGNRWGGIIGDTNAWDADHWLEKLHERWEMGEVPALEFFIQPPGVIKVQGRWTENPDAEIIPAAKGKYYTGQLQRGRSEDWIRVNLGNENGVVFDGRPVHPDYSDTVHTAHEMLQPKPGVINVGLDFGLTPAAVFFQRQNDGQWWGLEEIVIESDGDALKLGDAIKVRVADLRSRCKGELMFVFRGDPSGDFRKDTDSSTPYSILRTLGIHALPCTSNDPEIRRAALKRPMTRLVGGKPGLILSPKLKSLRKSLAGGFHYARVALAGEVDRFRDVPVKDMHSHVAEAAEYALLDAGEHSIVNANTPITNAFPRAPIIAGSGGPAWDPFKS